MRPRSQQSWLYTAKINTTLIQGWIKESAPQTLIQRLFHLSPHTRLGSQVRGGERQVSGQQRGGSQQCAALEEEGSAARAARVAPPAADLTLQDGGRGQPWTRAQPASPPRPSPTTGSAGSAAGASGWSVSRMLLSHIRLRSSTGRNTPGPSVLHCSWRLLIQWCRLAVSSSDTPFFFCLQSFPASGSFPMSWLFALGG